MSTSHPSLRQAAEPRQARRHLRLAPAQPPAARCPSCRATLDDWQCELARAERRVIECPRCGSVLV